MSQYIEPDLVKNIAIDENDATTTSTKKVLIYGWDSDTPQKVRLKVNSDGEVLIAKQTLLQAAINFSTAADHTIVAADATNKIKIVSMRLTVAGETNLTFKRGTTAVSGAMDFGGTGEPKGMVDGGSVFNPILETNANEAFIITSSAAVQVSGWVRYFKEA